MYRTIRLLFAFILFFGGFAGASLAAPGILSTEIKTQPSGELIVLRLSQKLPSAKLFTLHNPERVVLDVSTVEPRGLMMPKQYRGALVKGVRFGQFSTTTSRIVFELAKPLRNVSLHQFTDARGQLLVVDLVPTADLSVNEANFPSTRKKPYFPKSQVKKPLVVIDAGHGGKDPGATGRHGVEKDVTLPYALALRDALLRTGRYRVALTRETDTFILLGDRVRMARAAGGHIFISLHADSAPKSFARGLSIYTVSEKASDSQSEALAAAENAVDRLGGMTIKGEEGAVADILIDLAQRDTKNKSMELADGLVRSFTKQGIHLLPHPQRYAGFRVLKAPDIPSVLIELGFISEPKDEAMLKSKSYRQQVLTGIAMGLDAYFRKHPVE